jgi:hypothetical protein
VERENNPSPTGTRRSCSSGATASNSRWTRDTRPHLRSGESPPRGAVSAPRRGAAVRPDGSPGQSRPPPCSRQPGPAPPVLRRDRRLPPWRSRAGSSRRPPMWASADPYRMSGAGGGRRPSARLGGRERARNGDPHTSTGELRSHSGATPPGGGRSRGSPPRRVPCERAPSGCDWPRRRTVQNLTRP